MSVKKTFGFALDLGEIMLRNGAETYRVEDTIIRVLKKTGCDVCEAFVTPTGIFATLDHENMDTMTYVKRVSHRTIHMYKVALANQLSRDFCNDVVTIEEASKRVKLIAAQPPYPDKLILFAMPFASAAFTLVFNGVLVDAFAAMIIGFFVGIVTLSLKKLEVSKFFIDIVGGMLIASIGLLLFNGLHLGLNFETIIAGAIIPFVPGVAITNAIYDIIQGNLLSGISRTVEAFIIAASLAVGIGVVLSLYAQLLGGIL